MGRHATTAAPTDPDEVEGGGGRVTGLVSRLLPRLVLAATGAVTTTLAVAWAGNAWSSAALAGAAVGVVVLAAAWLASTVPAPPPASAPDDGRDPVQ